MFDYMLIVIGLAVVALLVARGARIWIDSRALGWHPARRLGWALLGAVVPSSYWWDARVGALEGEAQETLLRDEMAALDVEQPDALTCPLCGAQVPRAWALDADGRVTVAPGPVECPECDFRLDACRHCAHFLPGPPRGWAESAFTADDMTYGRCGFYKSVQPVEQAADPDMARKLKERGYDQIRAPRPIADSFVPPASCRAFKSDRGRLKMGGVGWPDARRAALMKVAREKDETR
ncbi:MAG TPA: hypothetical protein VLC53_01580 [Myxococcota bacterium]|nr:hypothetical protein [Myxococcota bacterium]